MARQRSNATITAANNFTPPVFVQGDQRFFPGYAVSITGTFVASVTVQRSIDGNTWNDVQTVTGPAELDFKSGMDWFWRTGVKTGNFTSGSVAVKTY